MPYEGKDRSSGAACLTPREREVAGYLLNGCANKVIAMDLGISLRTVEAHRARIFNKMGVRHAVALAHLFYRLNEPDLTASYLAVKGEPESVPDALSPSDSTPSAQLPQLPQLQLGNLAEDNSSIGSKSG